MGVAMLPAVYALARRLGGETVALLATAIIATSPFHLYYGQEARMYALLALACLLAMWGMVVIVQTSVRTDGGDACGRGWLAYVGGTALALRSHDAAVLFWLIAAVLLIGAGSGRQSPRAGFLRRWLLAQLAVLVLWSPWAVQALEQMLTDRGTETMAIGDALKAWERLYLPLQGLPLSTRWELLLAGLGLSVLVGHGLWHTVRDPRWERLATMVLWLVAPILLCMVGPVLFHRALAWEGAARAVIWTSVPAAVVMAGAVVMSPRRLAAVAVIGLLTLNLTGAVSYFRHPKARKETIGAHVARRARRGDLVIFYLPSGVILFDYYYSRFNGPAVIRHGIPADFPGRPGALRRAEWLLGSRMTEESIGRLEQYVRQHRRVWFVYGWARHEPFPPDRIRGLVRVDTLPGAARVYQYEGAGGDEQRDGPSRRELNLASQSWHPDAVPSPSAEHHRAGGARVEQHGGLWAW